MDVPSLATEWDQVWCGAILGVLESDWKSRLGVSTTPLSAKLCMNVNVHSKATSRF
jgi:hypothetical protein